MLMQIFKRRYGKALIGVCLLIAALYLGTGWQSQKDWHNQYTYLYSDEFVDEYTNHPNYYVKSYDGEKEILYDSIDDYRQDMLTIKKSTDESEMNYNNFSYAQSEILLVFLFIAGFLVFFVDYRTNFTRFLLSLPAYKKEIFLKKILFILLPIIGTLAIGLIGNCLIRVGMIGQPYFAVSLSDMLLSGLSTLFTNLLVFVVGMFFGIALGNLISGPLSILFILFLSTMGSYFYSSCYQLYHLIFTGDQDAYPSFTLWIDWPEGISYKWWAYLLYAFLIILLLVLAEKIFLRLSLDNEGDYVTVPALRSTAYWLMALGTWFYLTMSNYIPHRFFYINLYEDYHDTYQGIIIGLVMMLLFCLVISLLMVYPKALMNWWHKRRNKIA